jgi:hypothetical protein
MPDRTNRVLRIYVLLLLLLASKASPGVADEILKVPFECAIGKNAFLIHAWINDKPALLILDTSSPETVLHRQIGAGKAWKNEIDKHLNSADIILLLVSPDFLASGYIRDVEVETALRRHNDSSARVIPIILRPSDWKHTSLAILQALPTDGRSVVEWTTRDRAFADIVAGIRKLVNELRTETNRGHHRQIVDSGGASSGAQLVGTAQGKASAESNGLTRVLSAVEAYNEAQIQVKCADQRILSVVDWTVPYVPTPDLAVRKNYYSKLWDKIKNSGIVYQRIVQLPRRNADTMKHNRPFVEHLRECVEARDNKRNPAKNVGIFLCDQWQQRLSFLVIDSRIVFIEFSELVEIRRNVRCARFAGALMIKDNTGDVTKVFEKTFANLMSYVHRMEMEDIKRFEQVLLSEEQNSQ